MNGQGLSETKLECEGNLNDFHLYLVFFDKSDFYIKVFASRGPVDWRNGRGQMN